MELQKMSYVFIQNKNLWRVILIQNYIHDVNLITISDFRIAQNTKIKIDGIKEFCACQKTI